VTIEPRQAGLKRAKASDIAGGSPEENVEIARRLLQGEKGAYRDGVVLAASVALVAADKAKTFRDAAALAAQSIDSGAAQRLLDRWIAFTQS
jgi:anthranilate phosphoribosyltransferase